LAAKESEGSYIFGIGYGPSKAEEQQFGALNSASQFATGLGEGDLTKSSDFMSSILSGDSSKISQALAPQIGSAKERAQQGTKTAAEFGGRSGGTAASTAATNDKVHSDITDLIGSLTGSSVSGLATAGSDLLGKGISGTTTAFNEANTMQKQRAAIFDDIFKSSAQVAGAVAGMPGVSGTGLGQGLDSFNTQFGG
jgi:hypothetical protein